MQVLETVLSHLKFEKWANYANEMTDGVIHSTQYYIEYINRAILANLVESYCQESNISDTNWLRYLFSSYLNIIWLSV